MNHLRLTARLALASGLTLSSLLAAGIAHAAAAASPAAEATPIAVPTPLPAGATVSLPAPTRFKLSNGLTVLVVERHNLPLISITAEVRAGDAQDPASKPGVAGLLASILRRGTTHRTAPQIAEAIDFVGGSLATASGAESSTASLSVLKRDLSLGLDVLSDVLLHPAFPAKELQRLAEDARAGLMTSLDDPNSVVQMAFNRTVLAGHPYGRSATLTSLKRIGVGDLRGFYQAYYRPNNAFMVVVGDITPAEARTRLEHAFGGWKAKAVPRTAAVAEPAPTRQKQLVLVDMPVNQSFITLGHVGVKRNNPDYFALTVLNYVLGGDFSSRLNMTIRDKQGLAYGAGSHYGMMLNGGTFSASLNTKSETTGQALSSLVHELSLIRSEPVGAEELSFAKDYLTGSFPMRFETNADLAREVSNIEFYGLPADYLATYRDRVKAVTADDLERVAKRYLQPDRYVLVVVGKGSAVAPQMAPFGAVTRLDKHRLID